MRPKRVGEVPSRPRSVRFRRPMEDDADGDRVSSAVCRLEAVSPSGRRFPVAGLRLHLDLRVDTAASKQGQRVASATVTALDASASWLRGASSYALRYWAVATAVATLLAAVWFAERPYSVDDTAVGGAGATLIGDGAHGEL